MTSDKQIDANRQNALKSTGPKTPDGKDAVRLNALRHGLLSEEILLPGEDEEALRELTEGLRDELQPVGELEGLLVDRITSLLWRLRRLARVEAGVFLQESYGDVRDSDASTLGLAFIRDGNGANAFSKLSRYETTMERASTKRCTSSNTSRPIASLQAVSLCPWPWTWTSLEYLRVTAEVWLCFAKTEHRPSGHNASFVSEDLIAEGCSTI